MGVVWEPVPAFNMTVDYWNIETKQQIAAVDPQLVIDNPGAFPVAQLIRDPSDALPGIPNSGTILAVTAPFQNLNKTKTDGIDVSARYKWNAGNWGNLTAQLDYTHVLNFKRTLASGDTYSYAGTHGPTSLSSAAGMPQDKANLALTWERGPWSTTGTIRYIGGMDDIESKEQTTCLTASAIGTEDPNAFCTVSSFTTFDLAASYKGFKNWEIFGSIINVFNRKAPFDYTAGYGLFNYNFNYAFAGVMGTQFNIGARYTF